MSFKPYSLPVHLLRQHTFCPRIPWFHEVLGLRPARPEWVRQGEAFHREQPGIFRHRSLKRFGLQKARRQFNVAVSSSRWQMHGIVDMTLETADSIYAVEIKLSGHKPTSGHLLQLTAYSVLLQENTGKNVHTGFVVMHQRGKTYPVKIDQARKEYLKQIYAAITDNLMRSGLPDSSATAAQCTQCEFLNFCNDRA